ncbi:major facilitator superfamily domain-containing protein [Lasiosphaeria miniovina]|uniref:Major facilitator superfamily domain-containing protein n=1 Tax=Lasiosphaeria miniovina TaxID=1954250 RepID=A0AA40AB10_9PEZI|nr:major facilitator superfamily domain-containing protein [Lasiosphaeria miniovina]KAK0712568.1 major facilitator superfamily domain-containing protein [Lasiosphaeria miniovina]
MPFGILDDKKMEVVPGTAFLSDQDDLPPELSGLPRELLKHGTGRFKDVILVPQPSDSPNDPKKELILFIVGLSAAVVGAYGPMLSPGFVQVAADLNITVEVLAQSTAWVILMIGLALFLTNPLAKIIGRRPVYILAIVIMFVTSVWGAAVSEYNSFLASRVIAGIGMAPYEVLVQCTIGDLYFVHERATRIAVWNLFLLTGISGGALIAGQIIDRDGYRWTFGVCAIMFGLLMLGVVFLVPETAYRRDSVVIVPAAAGDDEKHDVEGGTGSSSTHEMKLGHDHDAQHVSEADMHTSYPAGAPAGADKKHTYWQSLRVFSGRYSYAPGWKVFVRPVVMLFYPAVMWGFLIYGTTLTWIVVFSVVNGVIFVGPPYNFSISQTGLISLSPFLLTVIGELVSGPLNDWICIYLTKKNRGVYEPEFRLPLMVVATVVGVVGFFGFGATVQYQTHWLGPVLCFGLANMSLVFASTCVFGYVVDSYRSHNEEAFVAINARNLLTFGLTYFVNDWLAEQGALVVFCILGSLFLFVCLLTIPLWVFGKKCRSFTGRNEWLQRFMNDNH